MSVDRSIKDHLYLTAGMVGRLGTPLGARAIEGSIDARSLGTLVTRCRQCPFPASCAAWQADHPDGAGDPPPYCLNRDRLADMAAGKPMEAA